MLARYAYNDKQQKWEPRKLKALPTSWFTWWKKDAQEGEYNHRRTNFILDTRSTINLMNQREVATKGIKVNNLPKVKLNITRATGESLTDLRQLSVYLTSKETGLTHQEELYISPEAKDNIISYEMLKRLEYTHTNNGTESPKPEHTIETTNTNNQRATINLQTKWVTW